LAAFCAAIFPDQNMKSVRLEPFQLPDLESASDWRKKSDAACKRYQDAQIRRLEAWVAQGIHERIPEANRASKFADEAITFLKGTGLKPKRTSIQAPWQNGTAERWVGSCRREMLDHVIALNEQHQRRAAPRLRDLLSPRSHS
jgi:thioesterase domain-containing protein